MRPDREPPMDFAANAIWLAREVKAQPMRLGDRPRVAAAALDAWTWMAAVVIQRALRAEQRQLRGAWGAGR